MLTWPFLFVFYVFVLVAMCLISALHASYLFLLGIGASR